MAKVSPKGTPIGDTGAGETLTLEELVAQLKAMTAEELDAWERENSKGTPPDMVPYAFFLAEAIRRDPRFTAGDDPICTVLKGHRHDEE